MWGPPAGDGAVVLCTVSYRELVPSRGAIIVDRRDWVSGTGPCTRGLQ